MKKKYFNPEIQVTNMELESMILSGSPAGGSTFTNGGGQDPINGI